MFPRVDVKDGINGLVKHFTLIVAHHDERAGAIGLQLAPQCVEAIMDALDIATDHFGSL